MAHRGWKRDGFTPAKKAKAIEALGKYGNVADAARIAGVSDTTFYRHLNRYPEFARSCELAREKAAKPLETLAWERATQGVAEKVIRNGEVVQIRVKPSDAMLGMLLRASDPKKYGRLSRGGAPRRQIERKLRKRIEAEVREEVRVEAQAQAEARRRESAADAKALFDELAARIAEMEQEELAQEARAEEARAQDAGRRAGGGAGRA